MTFRHCLESEIHLIAQYDHVKLNFASFYRSPVLPLYTRLIISNRNLIIIPEIKSNTSGFSTPSLFSTVLVVMRNEIQQNL